jgi:hypothetical protein
MNKLLEGSCAKFCKNIYGFGGKKSISKNKTHSQNMEDI